MITVNAAKCFYCNGRPSDGLKTSNYIVNDKQLLSMLGSIVIIITIVFYHYHDYYDYYW